MTTKSPPGTLGRMPQITNYGDTDSSAEEIMQRRLAAKRLLDVPILEKDLGSFPRNHAMQGIKRL